MPDAHDAMQTHHYLMHYPAHPPRAGDPHYVDFNHYHKLHAATATCFVADRIGSTSCSTGPLELHHAHIEFSLTNGVDLKALEVDYPGISNPDEVGAWVESAANFRWLCAFHHRGHGGAHTAAHADFEASLYIKGLIT